MSTFPSVRALELRAQFDKASCDFGLLVDFLARELVARHLLEDDRTFFPLFAGKHDGAH
ncbi:hypothetical protein [uncultured Thiodictyon sp.]|uniref:hypothetical protein n=1 Tax=uncultured Thiodictyon sp. TaxID=1846217 RepID=UPI0025D80BE0|nr:hypothetical protein [uncultured Thiodictyon sp.]